MSVHFTSAAEAEDFPVSPAAADLPFDDISYNALLPYFTGGRSIDDIRELLVLHAGLTAGIGRARQADNSPPLGAADRQRRIRDLFRLWASGCKHAIDEGLFCDIAAKRPGDLAALRAGQRGRR